MNYYLTPIQISYLKEKKKQGYKISSILRAAAEYGTKKEIAEKARKEKILQSCYLTRFSCDAKLAVSGEALRDGLDYYISKNPVRRVDFTEEIKKLDSEIEEMFSCYGKMKAIDGETGKEIM